MNEKGTSIEPDNYQQTGESGCSRRTSNKRKLPQEKVAFSSKLKH
jgi:hypothetical protein